MGGLSARQVRRVQELIAARAAVLGAASPTLSQLAAEANLSLHHFAREFRRTVGSTPYAYMLRHRLERAHGLLARSDLPLAEVGRRAGFPSPAHFTDRFRCEMGVTPGALRRPLASKLAPGVPPGPGRLRITPDGRTLLVTVNAARTLEIIDTETLAVRLVVDVEASPMGMAVSPDSRTAYIASTGAGTISVVDLVAGRITQSLAVGKGPEFLLYALVR